MQMQSQGFAKSHGVMVVRNERALLDAVLEALDRVDPDVLVGHNISFDLDVLLHRMSENRVASWVRFAIVIWRVGTRALLSFQPLLYGAELKPEGTLIPFFHSCLCVAFLEYHADVLLILPVAPSMFRCVDMLDRTCCCWFAVASGSLASENHASCLRWCWWSQHFPWCSFCRPFGL